MKKEYVKPQNLVVELKDKLMQGPEVISMGEGPGPGGGGDAKDFFDDSEDFDSGDSPKNLWDD